MRTAPPLPVESDAAWAGGGVSGGSAWCDAGAVSGLLVDVSDGDPGGDAPVLGTEHDRGQVVDFVLARQEPEGVDIDDPGEFAVVIEVGGEDDVAVVVVGVGGGVVFDPGALRGRLRPARPGSGRPTARAPESLRPVR